MGFTPAEYIALRNIEIQSDVLQVERERIQMAKEKKDVTLIMTSGGGSPLATFKVGANK